MSHTDTTPPASAPVASNRVPSSSAGFCWFDDNRTKGFDTWADEIAHVEAQGYKLVSPDYHIPHWSQSDAPKIYINGRHGVREMNAAFDRPARDIGYPLFFKQNSD